MATTSAVVQLVTMCQQRWPQIMAHCSDPEPIRRVLFCLSHAGLCSAAEIEIVTGQGPDPDQIACFRERILSYPVAVDRGRLASSLSLFNEIASPETFRKSLTGQPLTFPFDVVVNEQERVSLSDQDLRILNDDLEQLKARLSTTWPIPDRAGTTSSEIATLLDHLRLFISSFQSSFMPLLQSNAPLLNLRVSPTGEQLGATAADLSRHLATFRRLTESIDSVRRSVAELAHIDRKHGDGRESEAIFEQDMCALRRCAHILQTIMDSDEP